MYLNNNLIINLLKNKNTNLNTKYYILHYAIHWFNPHFNIPLLFICTYIWWQNNLWAYYAQNNLPKEGGK